MSFSGIFHDVRRAEILVSLLSLFSILFVLSSFAFFKIIIKFHFTELLGLLKSSSQTTVSFAQKRGINATPDNSNNKSF